VPRRIHAGAHPAELLKGLQDFGVDLGLALAQLLLVGALGAHAARTVDGRVRVAGQGGVVAAHEQTRACTHE